MLVAVAAAGVLAVTDPVVSLASSSSTFRVSVEAEGRPLLLLLMSFMSTNSFFCSVDRGSSGSTEGIGGCGLWIGRRSEEGKGKDVGERDGVKT